MKYGRVTGTFTTAVKNSSGANELLPLQGRIEIEPAVSHVIVDGQMVLPTTVTLTLVNGVVHDGPRAYVDLLATNNPGQNPRSYLYRAEPHLTFQGKSIFFKPFYFALPGDETTSLSKLVPQPYPGRLAIATPQGPQGPRGDNAEVVEVESFSDVTEPLPAGTLVVLRPSST